MYVHLRPRVTNLFSRKVTAFLIVSSLLLGFLILPPGSTPFMRAAEAAATDLFFSEYIEGSSNNKALEIYNGTAAAVNLGALGYKVEMYFNGNTAVGFTANLTGTVPAGGTFVLAPTNANATILAAANQQAGAAWFNGDDAVVLSKGTTILDVIGQVGFDPGTEWGTGTASTADNTIRRKSTVCSGDTNGSDPFVPAVEWDGFAQDTFAGLGSHTASCSSDPTPTPTVSPTPTPTPTPTGSPTPTPTPTPEPSPTPTPTPLPTPVPSDHITISQVYGGGGNSGATYSHDYVELYNPTTGPISVSGWSIQYQPQSSTGWTGLQSLTGSIGPGEYYLIKLASQNPSVGAPLPVTPNVEGTTINMAAGAGKVILVNNSTPLPAGCPVAASYVDLVGFGSTSAVCREGLANAPAPSNTTAIFRAGAGSIDTNQNGADFAAGAPNPRRTAPLVDQAPVVNDVDTDDEIGVNADTPKDGSFNVFFSEPVVLLTQNSWYSINCTVTGTHTAVTYTANPSRYIVTPDVNFEPAEQCAFTVFASQVQDVDANDSEPSTDFMQANYVETFTVASGNVAPEPPSTHLLFGNPTDAASELGQPNNYLMEKPEFSLSFNLSRGTPNWVSWHLSDDWTGFLTRIDTFRPDPAIPVEWNRVLNTDYSGSGFDRGHIVPSADRNEVGSTPFNQGTFLMTNMLPQAPDNNRITWNEMEQDLRTIAIAGNELYIVAGDAGTGGSGDNDPAVTIAGGKVTVPAVTWKVALVLPQGVDDVSRVSCNTRTIAVIVPNTNGTLSNWETYLTTVDAVEALTGYDFFENLPEPVERCVEAGVNGNNPPLDTDADGVPDSVDNCTFDANPDQTNTDGDAFGNACDTDDDNDGVTDDAEILAGSDPLNANSRPEICDGLDNDLNEGIDEGFTNTDGDNQADCVDADDDNDGVSDEAEIAAGSDPLNANSKPEVCDGIDNDLNEGVDEGFTNTDGDGQADCVDPDDDNDGVSDTAEGNAGSNPLDAASTPEVCDGIDNDLNDGVDEGFANTDGDTQANCVDPDDDNDGQTDTDEIACGSNPLLASSMAPDNDGDSRPDCVDPDDDNDGVADTADNCPLTPNSGQNDNDQDGTGDVCDADDDNDGVLDGVDNCRFSPNPNQSDNDSDGIGDTCDADDDNDGVLDVTDNCDFTPNPDQRDTNGDGVGDLCTAFQLPSGGQFVIGNLVNQTNGATVTFWSSQWAKDNTMSGGAGPKSFKGFENSPVLPSCGSTWSSSPGNSSNPPATIPRFMPVIVSSNVNQNGSVITGNVSRIVIVETNADYGPSPGQTGTGKVIAVLCTAP